MHRLPRISAPPVPALHLSMDYVSGSILPPDIGNIQGTVEIVPVLVSNGVRGKARQLDGWQPGSQFGESKAQVSR